MATLAELKVGEKAVISSLSACAPAYKRRLLAMGLTPGVDIILRHRAPFGDPVQIEVRKTLVSLRQQEAMGIVLNREPSNA